MTILATQEVINNDTIIIKGLRVYQDSLDQEIQAIEENPVYDIYTDSDRWDELDSVLEQLH